MYLSEAIRLGSMMGPQSNGHFYKDGAMCAQGAALAAVGKLHKERGLLSQLNHLEMEQQWPYAVLIVKNPVTHSDYRLKHVIADLNNGGDGFFREYPQWTREQIADWVEEQEYRLGIRVKEVVKDEVPELQEVR